MSDLAKRILKPFRRLMHHDLAQLLVDVDENLIYQNNIRSVLLGQLHIDRIRALGRVENLKEVEFQVFSQCGEDGIIQYLVNRVPIENKTFVEFGVENYVESNTRFLMWVDNWSGLVIDGDQGNIDYIRNDYIYWRHELLAVQSFITKDNINETIAGAGLTGDIGLLSVDMDGNDYWVWEAINVINPRIVICEYNSVFGANRAVSVPYEPTFRRREAHYSRLYFGASLPALCHLADQKGYHFVGSNTAGINAFFVRKDLSQGVRVMIAREGYVRSHVRESLDEAGNATYLSGDDRFDLIKQMPVIDVNTGDTIKLEG